MAKSISLAMEELRLDLARCKQLIGHMRAERQGSEDVIKEGVEILERWMADAETVLARWENQT